MRGPANIFRMDFMTRTIGHIVRTAVALAMLGTAALAQSSANPRLDAIVRQLQAQGYDDIAIGRTWLGRVRIEARSGNAEREIVVNPRTGEILRDYWDDGEGRDGQKGAFGGLIGRTNDPDESSDDDGQDESGSDDGGHDGGGDDGNDGGDGDGGDGDGDDGGGDDGGGDDGGGDDGGGDDGGGDDGGDDD